MLQANLAQLTVRDNQDLRKISAWVAIIAVPTMVVGIYGMNFDYMPELQWRFGYPLVLLLILSSAPRSTGASSAPAGSSATAWRARRTAPPPR